MPINSTIFSQESIVNNNIKTAIMIAIFMAA